MNKHTAILVSLVLFSLPVAGILIFGLPSFVYGPHRTDEVLPVACTQEARVCPDGSYVGRTGPRCEFALCPGPAGNADVPPASLDTFPEARE